MAVLETLLAGALASAAFGAAARRRVPLLAGALLSCLLCAGVVLLLLSPCYRSGSCAGLTFGDVALLLWSGLGASVLASVVGWLTRSPALTLTAGAMSLTFCWAGAASIGLLLLPIPLLDFGAGVAFLLRRPIRSPLS